MLIQSRALRETRASPGQSSSFRHPTRKDLRWRNRLPSRQRIGNPVTVRGEKPSGCSLHEYVFRRVIVRYTGIPAEIPSPRLLPCEAPRLSQATSQQTCCASWPLRVWASASCPFKRDTAMPGSVHVYRERRVYCRSLVSRL